MNTPKPGAKPPRELGVLPTDAGSYTHILSMSASPSPAGAGGTVTVVVSVRNLHTGPIYITVSGAFDSKVFSFTPEYINVNPGKSQLFSGNFIMPSKGVRVYAWSWYWTGEAWYKDDEKYIDVASTAPPTEYEGTITKKELKYQRSLFDWTPLYTIPVSDIPLNSKIRVHITGKNDTNITQALGIRWLIYDPAGTKVEDYSDWSYGHGPDDDHTFVTPLGDALALNKAGTYTIGVTLSMNPGGPVIVDQYIGDLCTVEMVAPPELETLKIKIDPAGAGYVTTDPEAVEGHPGEKWYNDDTGKFEHGSTVYVTAHPYSGYVFKSWSGEMKDTTAITAPVYDMTEHRLITAHFKEEAAEEPEFSSLSAAYRRVET